MSEENKFRKFLYEWGGLLVILAVFMLINRREQTLIFVKLWWLPIAITLLILGVLFRKYLFVFFNYFRKEWLGPLVIAVLVALVVRTFLVAPFKIPTGSMEPTLQIGDHIFVNRFLYRFREPRRGDIIVFKYPLDPKRDFVKRLVGLPGDKVRIREGRIYINGEVLDSPIIFNQILYGNRGAYGSEQKAITVPDDHYYVLGDNSVNSKDSRVWGFVPKKYLIGRTFMVWFPLRRIRLL